ncbi:MAG: hypothetical protein ACI9HK_003024 [Pirellulaceae bacterium]|jgi:hypothetical protein
MQAVDFVSQLHSSVKNQRTSDYPPRVSKERDLLIGVFILGSRFPKVFPPPATVLNAAEIWYDSPLVLTAPFSIPYTQRAALSAALSLFDTRESSCFFIRKLVTLRLLLCDVVG